MYREVAAEAGEEVAAGEGAVVEVVVEEEEDQKLIQPQPGSCMDPARQYQLQVLVQVYQGFLPEYPTHQGQLEW